MIKFQLLALNGSITEPGEIYSFKDSTDMLSCAQPPSIRLHELLQGTRSVQLTMLPLRFTGGNTRCTVRTQVSGCSIPKIISPLGRATISGANH